MLSKRALTFFALAILLAGSIESERPLRAATTQEEGSASRPIAETAHSAEGAVKKVTPSQLPLNFERNDGQTDPAVAFMARSHEHTVFLTSSGATIKVAVPSEGRKIGGSSKPQAVERTAVVRMQLVGANADPRIEGVEQTPGRASYFRGSDVTRWRANVPTFAKVRYREIYRGVDLLYYGRQGQLAYDFVVLPGASPDTIKWTLDGTEGLSIADNGDLLMAIAGGEIRMSKPFIYQEGDGIRTEVRGAYRVERNTVGFDVGAYDPQRPLIIDPTLHYVAILGGDNFDRGYGIGVDAVGNTYVTGVTRSSDFPATPGSYDETSSYYANPDVFVAKLDSTLSTLVYATYLGGIGDDFAAAIAIDAAGNAYVSGWTNYDFPVTAGAFDETLNGDFDAFVVKLNPTGSALVYSTYLGGNAQEMGHGLALDAGGNAYLSGRTFSTDFPVTAGSFDTSHNGNADAFVAKLNPSGSALVYSTFIGGSGDEGGTLGLPDGIPRIAVDSTGHAYVAGSTSSRQFPTTAAAFQQTCRLDNQGNCAEGFVTKLNPSGTGLVYSTFLGGNNPDLIRAIAVDSAGSAYVTGTSLSGNFPTTPGSFQPALHRIFNFDAVVTKLDATGSSLAYSTYLGGAGSDGAYGVAVDGDGNATVTGGTSSSYFGADAFPTTASAVSPTYRGGSDAFVSKLNAAGTNLMYSSYLGGFEDECGYAVAVDTNGFVYVTGATEGLAATPGAFSQYGSGTYASPDGFVAKIDTINLAPSISSLTAVPPAGPAPLSTTFSITASDPDGSITEVRWDFDTDGTIDQTTAGFTASTTYAAPGSYLATVTVVDDELGYDSEHLIVTAAGPVASEQSVTTLEDTPRTIVLSGSDPGGQPLTFSVILPPAHGTLGAITGTTCSGGTCSAAVTYTPNPDFSGGDFFGFIVSNGSFASTQATVIIEILPVQDGPPSGISSCFDPQPSPSAAGWVKHGTQSALPGNTLYLADASSARGDYVSFVCASAEPFPNEIRLAASVYSQYTTGELSHDAPYWHTGLHLTIDDGVKRITATIIALGDQRRLAIETLGGYISVFDLQPISSRFLLWRLADGSAVVEVPGAGRRRFWPQFLPDSNNPGSRSISFGTLDSFSSSISEWMLFGLGRPSAPVVLPGAVINAPSSHWVGNYATSLVAGDLTGDGKPDAAVVGFPGVSPLVNDGAGSFYEMGRFPAGNAPTAIAMGDFNGDTQPDVAVTNGDVAGGGGAAVAVLLASGATGAFGAPTSYAIASAPQALAIGDLNGDGNLDLVVGHQSGTVSVLRGDGSGSFSPAAQSPPGNHPVAIGVADLDADGDLDVATAGEASGGLFLASVLTNDGSGGLSAPRTFGVGRFPTALAIGDLNQDGKLDLATANAGETSDISILLGDGTGSFAPAVSQPGGQGPRSIAIGDLNGDGKPDLVTSDGFQNVYVMTATAGGGFAPPIQVDVGLAAPHHIALADVDADASPDIVVSNFASADLSVFQVTRNVGAPVAGSQIVSTDEDAPLAITLTGAAATGRSLSFTVLTPPSHGTLTGTAPNLTYVPAANFAGADSFTFKVNDGEADSNVATVSITVREINDLPTLTVPGPQVVTEGYPLTFTVAAADLDGPVHVTASLPEGASLNGMTFSWTPNSRQAGTHSIAFQAIDQFGATVTKNVSVQVEDGPVPAGCFDPIPNPLTTGWIVEGSEQFFPWAPLRLTDTLSSPGHFVSFYCESAPLFDAEIALHVRLSSLLIQGIGTGLHVTLNDGERQIRAELFVDGPGVQVALQLPGFERTHAFALPAFGAEFILRRLANGTGVLEVPGQGQVSLRLLDQPFAYRQGRKTIEFGTPQMMSLAASVSEWLSLGLPILAPTPSPVTLPAADPDAVPLTAAASAVAGYTPMAIDTADLNRDGALDLVTANWNSGDVSVLLGDGAGAFLAPTNFPVVHATTEVVTGDLNGDQLTDLVVSGYNSDRVFILLGNGGGGFAAPTSLTLGSPVVNLALADLTGDGKLDLAISDWRGPTVSILAGDGTGSFGAPRSALVGNGPSPMIATDWNSDGKLDLAAVNWLDDAVSVVHGDGAGAFGRPRGSALLPSLPQALAAGDLNGDGRIDLAVTVQHTKLVSVLLNDGAGGFQAPVHYDVGGLPGAIAVADFSGDGSLDVAVANMSESGGRLSIFLGDGNGALVAVAGFAVGSGNGDLVVGDFNGDAAADLAILNTEQSIVELLLSRTNRPPIANAGADQTVEANAFPTTQVVLNGSASSEPDGDPLTYRWTGPFPEGGGTVTGPNPTVTLPIGPSTVTLLVNDGHVDSAPDQMTVKVTVRPQGLEAPLAQLVPEGMTPPLPKKPFSVGKAVQLKLRLFAGATALTDQEVAPPRLVAAFRDGQPMPVSAQSFGWARSDRLWQLELKTTGWPAATYTVVIEMPDGQRFAAGFVLK